MTVKNKMVLPSIPKHQHYVVVNERVISRVLQNVLQKTGRGKWKNIRGQTYATTGYDFLILGYAEEAALADKELDCLPCCHCQQPIYKGDMCLSKRRSNSSTGHYHLPCAKKIHILV